MLRWFRADRVCTDEPRYALVIWKDQGMVKEWTVSNLEIDEAREHVKAGRVFLVAVEDWDCMPGLSEIVPAQSNPVRHPTPDDGA